MADFENTAATLRNHLIAGFTALPLLWPNDDQAPSKIGLSGFVYSDIDVITEGAVSLGHDGARTHRDAGMLRVIVYVPVGSLSGAAEKHAAAIRVLFGVNALRSQGITITSRRIGQGEHVNGPGGRWYAVPVTINWFSDRIE